MGLHRKHHAGSDASHQLRMASASLIVDAVLSLTRTAQNPNDIGYAEALEGLPYTEDEVLAHAPAVLEALRSNALARGIKAGCESAEGFSSAFEHVLEGLSERPLRKEVQLVYNQGDEVEYLEETDSKWYRAVIDKVNQLPNGWREYSITGKHAGSGWGVASASPELLRPFKSVVGDTQLPAKLEE